MHKEHCDLEDMSVTVTLHPAKTPWGRYTTTKVEADRESHPGNYAIIAGIGYHTMLRKLSPEERQQAVINVVRTLHHKDAYAFASELFLALKEVH